MTKKTKEKNLKELSLEELMVALQRNRQDLFKLRFRTSTAPIKNVMSIRNLKRDIARIHTFLNQKRSHA